MQIAREMRFLFLFNLLILFGLFHVLELA